MSDHDLPAGYRWAREDEMNRADAIVVPLTADSTGKPYTDDEADLAVPMHHHDIGHYRPLTLLADRSILQPESVAYGSAAHPERGGMGHVVPLFAAARDAQTITIHQSIHGPTTIARVRH